MGLRCRGRAPRSCRQRSAHPRRDGRCEHLAVPARRNGLHPRLGRPLSRCAAASGTPSTTTRAATTPTCPASCSNGDLKFANQQMPWHTPDASNRWPAGVAFAAAPAFLVAHGLCLALRGLGVAGRWAAPTGYSVPYLFLVFAWLMLLGAAAAWLAGAAAGGAVRRLAARRDPGRLGLVAGQQLHLGTTSASPCWPTRPARRGRCWPPTPRTACCRATRPSGRGSAWRRRASPSRARCWWSRGSPPC